MVINNNPMNPVPLWTSKNDWYCKKVTNHGSSATPVLPTGMLPKMALTVKEAPTSDRRFFQVSQGSGMPSMFLNSYSGFIYPNPKIENEFQVAALPQDPNAPKLTFTKNGDVCSVKMKWYSSSVWMSSDVYLYENGEKIQNIPVATLAAGGSTFIMDYNGSDVQFVIGAVYVTYYFSSQVSVSVYKCADNTLVATEDVNYDILGCEEGYSVDRSGNLWIGGSNLTGTFDDGLYYMQFTLGSVTYYSEPFMWLTNLNQYLHVVYRRSTPVVTTDNCIVFEYDGTARSLEAWLPGLLLMPPFTFNDEVDEIDGRKFVRKQVSYKDEKCEFMCTAYFAEAIRLLWHCDIRTAGGMRVEYMVRPEIDWNTDNHLCDVKLEFQGDTVMQTNGTASAYGDSSDSSHQSYDASFDASFN